jgi:hypothetical protein
MLISGPPGTGKSLLLAKWLSLTLEKKGTKPQSHQNLPIVLYHSVSETQSISGKGANTYELFQLAIQLIILRKFYDQGQLWGHKDTPFGRPTPGRPIGRPGVCRPRRFW